MLRQPVKAGYQPACSCALWGLSSLQGGGPGVAVAEATTGHHDSCKSGQAAGQGHLWLSAESMHWWSRCSSQACAGAPLRHFTPSVLPSQLHCINYKTDLHTIVSQAKVQQASGIAACSRCPGLGATDCGSMLTCWPWHAHACSTHTRPNQIHTGMHVINDVLLLSSTQVAKC